MSAFLATTLPGEVGGRRYKPKAEQKIVLGSRVLCNICLEGLFRQSQALLSSIVWNWFRAIKWIFRHLSLQKYGKTFSLELLKCSFLVKCFLYAAADPSVALKSYGYLAKRGYSAWTFSLPKVSDYLNDAFCIELLKAFNAGSTYFYHLRRCT